MSMRDWSEVPVLLLMHFRLNKRSCDCEHSSVVDFEFRIWFWQIMKFLGRKDKSEGPKKPQVQHEGDFQAGVIRVQAPHLNMCTTAVQLDQSTTASDIVARFCNSSIVDVDIGSVFHQRMGLVWSSVELIVRFVSLWQETRQLRRWIGWTRQSMFVWTRWKHW